MRFRRFRAHVLLLLQSSSLDAEWQLQPTSASAKSARVRDDIDFNLVKWLNVVAQWEGKLGSQATTADL